MTKFRRTLNVLAVAIFTLTFASIAQAQASRTWVSGVGDDVNPCSRTAPCKTFAGAISKTADGGEISVLDPGGFGGVTITKGMTIDGSNGAGFGSILAAGAGVNGIVFNDNSGTNSKVCVLRNLSINGATTGNDAIRFIAGKALHVENVDINGFQGDGIEINTSVAGGSFTFIDDVDIVNTRGASSVGIKISAATGTAAVAMDHVRIQRAPVGIQANNNTAVTIRNSMVTLGGIGVEMTGNANSIIENTMLTNNTTGLSAGGTSISRISQVSIILNVNGIAGASGVRSSGNNRILNNTNPGTVPTIINPQ
jgi:hypothetical protein